MAAVVYYVTRQLTMLPDWEIFFQGMGKICRVNIPNIYEALRAEWSVKFFGYDLQTSHDNTAHYVHCHVYMRVLFQRQCRE